MEVKKSPSVFLKQFMVVIFDCEPKRKRLARIFLCDYDYYTDIPRVNHVFYSLSSLPTKKGEAECLRGRSVFCALSFLHKLLISA